MASAGKNSENNSVLEKNTSISNPVLTNYGSFSEFDSQSELCSNTTEEFHNLKQEYTGIKRYGGMLLTLFASLCFSFVTLMVKKLQGYGFDPYSSSFWRYLGVTLPTILILIYFEWGPGRKGLNEKKIKKTGKSGSIFDSVWPIFENENWKTWIGLLSRGLIGSSSVILRYFALQYLTLGDTSVITYSTPVIVTVMAHFILGEKCGVVPVIITITTLIGVIIVIKPPILTGAAAFDSNMLIGTGLALGSLFCASLIVIITRKLREVHFALMICVFGLCGLTQTSMMAYTVGHGYIIVPSHIAETLLTLGVACISFTGQIAIILALKFEQAGPVCLLRSLDVVFGYILQYFFLDVIPDAYSAIGGIIVLTGVTIIASRKWISTLEDDSKVKNWFGWVML